jgi:hypothetical protein
MADNLGGGLNRSGNSLGVSMASDSASLMVDENSHARFLPYSPVYVRFGSVFGTVIAPFIARFCPFSFSLNERRKIFLTTVRIQRHQKNRKQMASMGKMDIRLKTPIKNGENGENGAPIKTRKQMGLMAKKDTLSRVPMSMLPLGSHLRLRALGSEGVVHFCLAHTPNNHFAFCCDSDQQHSVRADGDLGVFHAEVIR